VAEALAAMKHYYGTKSLSLGRGSLNLAPFSPRRRVGDEGLLFNFIQLLNRRRGDALCNQTYACYHLEKMMKRIFSILLTTVLANTVGVLPILPAIAESKYCNDPGPIPAAETTRELELPQFGVTLAIPSNFRSILRNNGAVEIVNPGTYQVLTCVAQGGQALGRGYASIIVRSIDNPDKLDLQQFIAQNSRLQRRISPYALGDQQGYLVESRSDSSAQFWISPADVPDVVVISAGCDCRGMRDRLVSILDRSSLLTSR